MRKIIAEPGVDEHYNDEGLMLTCDCPIFDGYFGVCNLARPGHTMDAYPYDFVCPLAKEDLMLGVKRDKD